ncbi:hypothetical protein LSAT2_017999 [Lamellibrachia satsuma]|nr:hypothetical protein LSAT2_017999 [Lamellibrachia satsuma]
MAVQNITIQMATERHADGYVIKGRRDIRLIASSDVASCSLLQRPLVVDGAELLMTLRKASRVLAGCASMKYHTNVVFDNRLTLFWSLSDTLFANWTELAGRNVTCDNWKHPPVKFPSDTWSCYNIRELFTPATRRAARQARSGEPRFSGVDGRRLRYWYIPGFGAETHCSDGKKKNDGLNDVAALCRAMLKAHGISRELWTAYVNDASCRRSNKERFVFRKVNGKYKFDTFPSGHGYVILLRCMTAA